jgi:hypothetical protein
LVTTSSIDIVISLLAAGSRAARFVPDVVPWKISVLSGGCGGARAA